MAAFRPTEPALAGVTSAVFGLVTQFYIYLFFLLFNFQGACYASMKSRKEEKRKSGKSVALPGIFYVWQL